MPRFQRPDRKLPTTGLGDDPNLDNDPLTTAFEEWCEATTPEAPRFAEGPISSQINRLLGESFGSARRPR